MLRRALAAFTLLFAGAAALMLGFALAGPGTRAGAVPADPGPICVASNCATTTLTPATVPTTTKPPATAPATAPPTTHPVVTQPPARTTPRTTVPATTTTASTLPSIGGGNLPVTPSTVPFRTKQQSSHVSPVFAALSGAGLFVAFVIVLVRFITSRPPN